MKRLFFGFGILMVSFVQSAYAIPAFARKYGTSCQTCHTIYPKLTPFGEAFRRDGYRFPGVDSDVVKQDVIPLGQEEQKKQFPNSVWPGSLPASVPLAFGFNGAAVFHPQKDSSGAIADNGSRVVLGNLVEEGHVWAGGSFDDKTTYFGEVTFSDTVELEIADVIFSDLFGPKHAVNLSVGKVASALSSFGPHSSYVADNGITTLSVTALNGATSDSWNVGNHVAGVEFNGVLGSRFDYSTGVNAGTNVDTRNPQNAYVHAGYKFGGMPLDGEGSYKSPDPTKPWEDTAITSDLFYYYSTSQYTDSASTPLKDTTHTFGGSLRAQWNSLELNTGAYEEKHNNALTGGGKMDAIALYNELSYVVFPWLVPAVRVEWAYLSPNVGSSVNDLIITPGVAALVRPNLKFVLAMQIEKADGAPAGGWGASESFGSAVPSSPTAHIGPEVESVTLNMAYAF